MLLNQSLSKLLNQSLSKLLNQSLSKTTLIDITKLAWPMALNAVLLQSVPVIDLLLVASLGDVSVAGYGIAGAIITLIIGIQFAIANGTQLVLSRAVGTGDVHKIGQQLAAGWLANLTFSISAILLLVFGTKSIIHLITHDLNVAKEAISYIYAALFLLIFSSISQVIVVYFNAKKNTLIPLYGFIIEIPLNILFSAILIHGLWGFPKLGLMGAAWGSVIGVIFRFLYMIHQFHLEVLKDAITDFIKVNKTALKKHLDEVIPIVANFVVLLVGQMLFQALFAQLPVPSYAAITLVLPWITVGSTFVNSWAQSSTIIVSQHLGKQEFKSIPPFVMQSKWVATMMSFLMVIAFYGFSCLLPHLYPNLSTETLTALALIAPIYTLIPLIRTNNMFCGHMVRALGKSYLIVRINIITVWCISLPLCAFLIYLKSPISLVFGVILFDELLKFYPFKSTLKGQLRNYH